MDQISKAIIVAAIPLGGAVGGDVDSFFHFTYIRNYALIGGAFGNIRLVVYGAPVLAFAVLLYLFKHLDVKSGLHAVSYGMVAGGAIGNLVDRFARGFVVDFLQFHFHFIPFDFPWKRYPAFNVADSAICVGVFLLIIGWHRYTKENAPDTV